MTTPIKIDKNVPAPCSGDTGYPFADLKIGESFFVSDAKPTTIRSAGTYAHYKTGFKFQSRTVTENGVTGVRVWRIK